MFSINSLLEGGHVVPARVSSGLLFRIKHEIHLVDEEANPVKGFLITRRLRTDQKFTLSLVYDEVENLGDLISLGLWDTNPVSLDLEDVGVHESEAEEYIPFFPDEPVSEEIEITGLSFYAQLS